MRRSKHSGSNTMVGALLVPYWLLARHGHGSRQLNAYMQNFMWRKGYANCRERSRQTNVRPAGSASEILNVGPIVRKWLEGAIRPTGLCPAQVTSLLPCIMVKVITGFISPAMLADAMASHYPAHGHSFSPKFHYMLHSQHWSSKMKTKP